MISWNKKEIPVDTGTMVIADRDYYGDFALLRSAYVCKVTPGKYRVYVSIRPSFTGLALRSHFRRWKLIQATSGEIWIGDPGQCVKPDKWEECLEKTNCHKKRHVKAIVINTGADGGYEVDLVIEPILEETKRYSTRRIKEDASSW